MEAAAWTSPHGTPVTIRSIAGVELRRVDRGGWPVDDDLALRIAEHWLDERSRNPKLWNGRVLGTIAPGQPGGLAIGDDGVLAAEAVELDFSAQLAWRAWGYHEIGIRNLFGSALIESADGALIYGRMAPATANAGRTYPPGGSLEPRDVGPDGRIDVFGSIATELAEETGLSAAEADVVETLAAFDGPRVSIARRLRFSATAAELTARIRADLDRQQHRELEDVVTIREIADLDPAVTPSYAMALAARLLGR